MHLEKARSAIPVATAGYCPARIRRIGLLGRSGDNAKDNANEGKHKALTHNLRRKRLQFPVNVNNSAGVFEAVQTVFRRTGDLPAPPTNANV
jgi:hypothetical protein